MIGTNARPAVSAVPTIRELVALLRGIARPRIVFEASTDDAVGRVAESLETSTRTVRRVVGRAVRNASPVQERTAPLRRIAGFYQVQTWSVQRPDVCQDESADGLPDGTILVLWVEREDTVPALVVTATAQKDTSVIGRRRHLLAVADVRTHF
jgi:hypothetical protein